ncbi:MAG: hypothetical protein GKR99_03690 [Rhodobacteraceae bacterium]|nr:hypothetical protein [Paracoccaceae bacterium]
MTQRLSVVALTTALFLANPAFAQKACYSQSDCECAASASNLRDGLWHVQIEPGQVAASNGRVFELNTAEGPLDLISNCDGTLLMAWQDEELGRIEWELTRVNQGVASPDSAAAPNIAAASEHFVPQIDTAIWDDFSAVSPELGEFTNANEFYFGETIYYFDQTPVIATMLLGYDGVPGRAQTHGDVSMTMRMGPYQGITLWMRTGKAQFAWVGDSDAARAYIFEHCRCRDVTVALESASLGTRLQQELIELHKNRQKRRVGYDLTADDGIMQNERFDPGAPIVKPTEGDAGNWPCLTSDQMDLSGKPTQVQLRADFKQEFGKIMATLNGQESGGAGRASTGAETNAASCAITPPESDLCVNAEVEWESMMMHEEVHRRACLDHNGRAQVAKAEIDAALSGAKVPGLSRRQAEQAALAS